MCTAVLLRPIWRPSVLGRNPNRTQMIDDVSVAYQVRAVRTVADRRALPNLAP